MTVLPGPAVVPGAWTVVVCEVIGESFEGWMGLVHHDAPGAATDSSAQRPVLDGQKEERD
ncbi:hypothetical protein [Nostocoides veronense]|uniref:Uncharacterized protein n=1 Tax=Nostocoides veronense TaxID=330836 RepID=A0ABP4XFY4_9MICO